MSERASHLWTDGYDTYAAVDHDHLAQLYEDHMGCKYEDSCGEPITTWEQVEDDEDQTVFWMGLPVGLDMISVEPVSDAPFPDCDYRIVAKASAWAEWKKAGFLCSTEV